MLFSLPPSLCLAINTVLICSYLYMEWEWAFLHSDMNKFPCRLHLQRFYNKAVGLIDQSGLSSVARVGCWSQWRPNVPPHSLYAIVGMICIEVLVWPSASRRAGRLTPQCCCLAIQENRDSKCRLRIGKFASSRLTVLLFAVRVHIWYGDYSSPNLNTGDVHLNLSRMRFYCSRSGDLHYIMYGTERFWKCVTNTIPYNVYGTEQRSLNFSVILLYSAILPNHFPCPSSKVPKCRK